MSSNSSAFSNVLLKPSVQPQATFDAKRDYQNDQSQVSFSQSLRNAQDFGRRQDDNNNEAASKKINSAEDHRSTKTTDKPLAEHNDKVAENTNRDNSTEKTEATGKGASASDKATDKLTKHKSIIKDDDSLSDATSSFTSPTDLPQKSPSLAVNLAASGSPITKSEGDTKVDSDEKTQTQPVATDLLTSSATPTSSTPVIATQSAVGEPLTAGQSLANVATAQQANAGTDLSGQQNAAVMLATSGALATEKSLAPTSSSTKTAASASGLKTDGVTEQSNNPSTKLTFEKTLEGLAQQSLSARDNNSSALNAALADSSSSTTSSTAVNNLLDSAARLGDAQSPAARSFVVQTAVPVSVGQPQWSQAVGEKVLWLAAQNVSSAEIHLHPEDLGPMQVKISINQDQTTVNFTSHHAVVREALDQNLNRLRDMFSDQGLNLVNVDVSDKSFNRQQGEGKEQQSQTGNTTVHDDETPIAVSTIVQQRLVDHYA